VNCLLITSGDIVDDGEAVVNSYQCVKWLNNWKRKLRIRRSNGRGREAAQHYDLCHFAVSILLGVPSHVIDKTSRSEILSFCMSIGFQRNQLPQAFELKPSEI
jgi:hypothetical protein